MNVVKNLTKWSIPILPILFGLYGWYTIGDNRILYIGVGIGLVALTMYWLDQRAEE